MLKSKKANILFAVLAAVCMWVYVTGTVDPTVTKKIMAVPITVINEDSLLQDGLAVENVDATTVDLVVEGSRADVNSINMDDVTVNADLYGRNKGINSIKLDVEIPKGIKVESMSTEKIQVEIEDMISRDFAVNVQIKGALAENTVLGKTEITPKYVTVYGTENNLDKISKVNAMVVADKLTEESSAQQAELKIKDANGREVSFVKATVSSVEVIAQLNKSKEVNLEVKTADNLAEGYILESINGPEKVYLYGPEGKLNSITKVYTEEINLSEIHESKTVMVGVVLPEGVFTADGTNKAEVKVVIKKNQWKKLQFKANEISLINTGEGLEAVVKTDLTAEILGTTEILNQVDKTNTKIIVDLQGLGAGNHMVVAKVDTEIDGVTDMVLSSDKVEVEIKEGN